jgi:hypothetical protein
VKNYRIWNNIKLLQLFNVTKMATEQVVEPGVESLAILESFAFFSKWKTSHECMILLILASVVSARAERPGQAFMMHAREDGATQLPYPRRR